MTKSRKRDYPNLAATLLAMGGQENIITVNRCFVDFTGSLEGGILLGQLLYWTPRATINGNWIAKTDGEFHTELCISQYGLRKARKALEEQGILETMVRKFAGNPTIHYRLNLTVLQEQWILWIRKNDLASSQEPVLAKSQDEPCEPKESCTETTPETTPEIITPTGSDKPPPPTSLSGWLDLVRESPNRPAALRFMIQILYPYLDERDLPSYGYVGKIARKLKAGHLTKLLWRASEHAPQGDILAYVQKMVGGGNNGHDEKRNGGNGKIMTKPPAADVDPETRALQRKALRDLRAEQSKRAQPVPGA